MLSSYVKRAMQHNEKVVYEAQLHWIIYRAGVISTLIGALIGYVLPVGAESLMGADFSAMLLLPIKAISIGVILLGFFQLVSSFIRQISTELVITDQRVIAKHGLIATTSYELMMSKVEGATIEQSILGRFLGYGTLMVKGTGGGISPIDHVARPFLFHSFLMDALRAAHEKTHTTALHD